MKSAVAATKEATTAAARLVTLLCGYSLIVHAAHEYLLCIYTVLNILYMKYE